jgi:hypothetical protein
MITFDDIYISKADQEFIDDLANRLDIDYWSIEIEKVHNLDVDLLSNCFANKLIYKIYQAYLNNIWLDILKTLEIIDEISKWINCLATSIPFDMDEYIKKNNLEEYREQLMKLEE